MKTIISFTAIFAYLSLIVFLIRSLRIKPKAISIKNSTLKWAKTDSHSIDAFEKRKKINTRLIYSSLIAGSLSTGIIFLFFNNIF
jgi:hypothetical protein